MRFGGSPSLLAAGPRGTGGPCQKLVRCLEVLSNPSKNVTWSAVLVWVSLVHFLCVWLKLGLVAVWERDDDGLMGCGGVPVGVPVTKSPRTRRWECLHLLAAVTVAAARGQDHVPSSMWPDLCNVLLEGKGAISGP